MPVLSLPAAEVTSICGVNASRAQAIIPTDIKAMNSFFLMPLKSPRAPRTGAIKAHISIDRLVPMPQRLMAALLFALIVSYGRKNLNPF